jgi:hypothetical protein
LQPRNGATWQIQVKGATAQGEYWFGYGHCTDAIIAGDEKLFNRKSSSFYEAEIVVLVCVKSPKEYECLVLPVEIAEKAVQINLDSYFRVSKRNGDSHKPGKVWVSLDWIRKSKDASRKALYDAEQELLKPYRNNWDCLENGSQVASP